MAVSGISFFSQVMTATRGDMAVKNFSLLAFFIGVVLLGSVLLIPGLNRLFLVSGLTAARLGAIVGLAFVPTLLIQIAKTIRDYAMKEE